MVKSVIVSERVSKGFTFIGLGIIVYLFLFNLNFLNEHIITTFDDAYMFIRYARNLLDGHGVAWNPDGVQTYGATSLIYVFLIAIELTLFPFAEYGRLLTINSFIFGVVYVAIMSTGTLHLAESSFLKQKRSVFPILLSIALMSPSAFRLHSVSGMDTNFSVLFNSLLIIATIIWVKRLNIISFVSLLFIAYVNFLTRPDTLIYSIAFPVLYGWLFLAENRAGTLIKFLVAISVILLLDTLLKLWIFGDPLPLPFYSKKAGFYDGYRAEGEWNPIPYLFTFFTVVFPFISILFFAAFRRNWKLILAFFLPVLLTFLYFFTFTQIMGFWARYYYPAVPFFVIGSFLALDQRLCVSEALSFVRWRVLITVTTLLFLIFPPFQNRMVDIYQSRFIESPTIYKSVISRELDDDRHKLGWRMSINGMTEISRALPEGTRIAMSEYGYLGAVASDVYIIDLVGLHDPYFAHNGFSSEELFRRRPDLIWFPPPVYTKIVASIQDDPALFDEYEYFPYAFDNGLAIRRDALHYDFIMALIKSTWQKYYPGLELERFVP